MEVKALFTPIIPAFFLFRTTKDVEKISEISKRIVKTTGTNSLITPLVYYQSYDFAPYHSSD